MKSRIFLSLGLLCFLCSCEKSSTDAVFPPCHPLEFSEWISETMLVQAYKDWTMNEKGMPTYTSFKDVVLHFAPMYYVEADPDPTTEERAKAIRNWRRSIILPLYQDRVVSEVAVSPYITAFLDGGIEIVSDVQLFGMSPGTNLSKHFQVVTKPYQGCFHGHLLKSDKFELAYQYVPRQYDSILGNISLPSAVEDYFFDGLVLCSGSVDYDQLTSAYCIKFRDIPEEVVDDLTLTIKMPIKEKLYSKAFGLDGSFDSSKVTDRSRTLTGSIRLSFN